MKVLVHDPRGAFAPSAVAVSPLPNSIAGLRIGVLDNTKERADIFLRRTAELLAMDGASITFTRKSSFSRSIASDTFDQLRICDLVITGLGG